MSLFLSGALVTEGLRAKYHWMYTFYSVYSVICSRVIPTKHVRSSHHTTAAP